MLDTGEEMRITTQQQFRRAILRAAWRGLKYQGFERAMNGEGCMWTDRKGRHCAVGWLIPTHKYKGNARTGTTETALRSKLLAAPLQNYADLHFDSVADDLLKIQVIHDCSNMPTLMRERLKELARDWNVPLPKR